MKKIKSRGAILFVGIIFFALASLRAGASVPAQKSLTAVPAGGPIAIDGVLSESVWQLAGTSGFTQTDPLDGQPETERTTVWIAFDRDFLYVAARLADKNPGAIVSRLGRRDEDVASDRFGFGIDPYYDKRSGYFFVVNPAGGIMDGTLFNDEEKDTTWDGIWDSAARIDDKGWTVEMRIPFTQLRFKRKDVYTWGVNFERVIKRKNETDYFAWRPKEESGFVFAVCRAVPECGTLIPAGGSKSCPISAAGRSSSRPCPEIPF